MEVINGLVNRSEDLKVVIKPHPDERYDHFARFAIRDGVDFHPSNVGMGKFIGTSDVVVTFSSTEGIEAILMDRPLISIDFEGKADGLQGLYGEVALRVYRVEDLNPSIMKALYDKRPMPPLWEIRCKGGRVSRSNYKGMALIDLSPFKTTHPHRLQMSS